jgi:hypothetical protein
MARCSRAAALATLLVTLLLTARAQADVWSVAPCVADHTGFFLRLAGGLSGVRLGSVEGINTKVDGVGALWDVALGWSVAPSIGLHLSYYGARPFVPRFALGGQSAEPHAGAEALLSGLGVGTTLYLPINIFFSPSLGVALVRGTDAQDGKARRAFFSPGLSAALAVGWEFWVSPQWALGVGLHASYYYLRNERDGAERTWHGAAGGPMFTSTFN